MGTEGKQRRILEIGPGIQPRHDLDEFGLSDNEEYVALDYNPEEFKAPIWQQLKERFSNRVNMVVGSRDAIPMGEDTFDEVIMLGSQGDPDKNIPEVDRVLSKGGILKLGVLKWAKEATLGEWQPLLEAKGFVFEGEKEHEYKSTMDRESDGGRAEASDATPQAYVVLSFRKVLM